MIYLILSSLIVLGLIASKLISCLQKSDDSRYNLIGVPNETSVKICKD